jgi:hypothetical protein
VRPDARAPGEGSEQARGEALHRVGVQRPLRAHRDQHSAQKLEPLVLEQAESHEAIVLATAQRAHGLGRE